LSVGLVDEVLGIGEDGDVGLDEDGFAAGGLGSGLGLLGLIEVIAIVDDDGCAFAGEADGDGLANAGAGAGDDGDFILQGGQGALLCWMLI
jgi:hypothetical protein